MFDEQRVILGNGSVESPCMDDAEGQVDNVPLPAESTSELLDLVVDERLAQKGASQTWTEGEARSLFELVKHNLPSLELDTANSGEIHLPYTLLRQWIVPGQGLSGRGSTPTL